MNQKSLLLLSLLCIFLPIVQTKCAAEAELPHARNQEYFNQGYFDVEAFVEKIENGEIEEEEIRANLNRYNAWRKKRRGCRIERAKPYSTNTPLIEAAEKNKIQALQALIRLGADLEATNQGGDTALMRAAINSQKEAVEVLAAAGAQLDYQGAEGRTAAICAAAAQSLGCTQALIDARADLNIQDNYKQTALIKVILPGAYTNPFPVVAALLNAKADTSIVDVYRKTAYVYAMESSGYPEKERALAQMLITAGAQPEQEMARIRQ